MNLRPFQFGSLCVLAIFTSVAPQLHSAELRITNVTWSPQGLRLDWTNLGTGTSYTVQAREWLGPERGLWLLPSALQPWPTTQGQWTDTTAISNQTRFYRVLGVPTAERGKILASANRMHLYLTTLAYLYQTGVLPIQPRYEVNVYKLNYETISPWGARVPASGSLVLPQGAPGALPLLSYQHGTIARTNDVPSISTNGEIIVGIGFATSGYAAVLPDYLGLGESEGIHPYHHAGSEATASVDLLRAARLFCESNHLTLSSQLFLCGYSQGGHSTMALFRELETYHTNEFTVTACAPMAGAYDLSGVTVADFMSANPVPNPYYFALLLAAYQDVYHLADALADMLVPPYNSSLPPLLRGNSSGSTINAALPNPPLSILKPNYLEAFRTNALHPLRLALQDNDLYRWTPRAPMRMYHCGGDRDVNPTNSVVALNSFHARGATQVELIIPSPTADHGGCVQPSLLQAKQWFDSLLR